MRFHRVFLLIVLLAVNLSATTSIDFEDQQDGTVITNQYAGLTFTNATVLTAGISLNELEFPPHSGMNVVFDDGGPITIFSDAALSSFGAYYTYSQALTATAFDSLGNIVGSALSAYTNNMACLDGPPCSGDPGSSPNEFIDLIFDSPFTHITIQGDPNGGSFTMDDTTFTAAAQTTPEASTFALSMVFLSLFFVRKIRQGHIQNL